MRRVTFRAKLRVLVGAVAVTLLAVLAGSAVIGTQRSRELADVESRIVPKLELGREVRDQFEQLNKGMQDAVAAQDETALDATEATRDRLYELIAAHDLLAASEATALREAIQKYDELARGISRRMIEGETGEGIVDDIAKMQTRRAEIDKLIKQTATLGRSELSEGFARIESASSRADKFSLLIGLAGLLVVLAFSGRMSRSILRSVENISSGFARFAKGDFGSPITVLAEDEMGAVAREANAMAASLERLDQERDRSDWLKEGQVALAEELRGELDVASVANRALTFAARRLDAAAGALYLADAAGELALEGRYAYSDGGAPRGNFQPGEGLVGQAALGDAIVVVDDVPKDYFTIRSGLGETSPVALVLVPLVHHEKSIGVIELALLDGCSDLEKELLESTRLTIASALVVARSRAAVADLLRQSQEQTQRLVAQEEELRLNNQELQAQEEELRRANEELEQQRRTLSQQNAELEATRVHLQQKAKELAKTSAYKSQFLANMSHELRTPLNSMLLLSHLLADNETGNLNEKQIVHCKTIHGAGQDLLALINQILDLAKIEAGRQDVEMAPVELERFLVHAKNVFEPLAAEKGLTLHAEIAPNLPGSIVTDAQRVERILTNLLGNAIKFTEQGEVKLRIERPAETTIAFCVSDTGVGIAPDAQQRIFEPFEQIEARTDRRYAGSGLGLAIVRESAALLGGEITVQSSVGRGSTFTLYLPATPVPVARVSAAPEVPDDRKTLERSEAHLLVIEDDPALAATLLEIIRARGFKGVVATNGEDGLRCARELEPYGIVLDVKLPDVDGWNVMQRLQSDPVTRAIPVHFISGLDERDRGLSLGAIGYLTKPASHSELVSMVRTLTPIASGNARAVLVVEDDEREGRSIVEVLAKDQIQAEHVVSGAAAIEALERSRFGCMILDLGLPDMDGLALLDSLRSRGDLLAPPVVVHTGRALTKQEAHQLEAYAEAIIVKDGHSAERLLDEVRLFVRHVEERLPAPRRPKLREPAPSDGSLHGTTILLAEDDMRTAYALSALLRGKGAEVLVAENGREALEILASRASVRGVLMDVMMPEMDGYEAMRRLRADARFADLPVIALTARAMKGERERCLAAGASEYLTKPVDAELLLSTLRAWLKPSGSDASGS